MRDFPDLATPAANATDPPSFEALLTRARRRRRRLVGGAVVLVALVGVIVGGVAAGHRPSATPVSPPAPSPSRAPSSSPSSSPGPGSWTANQIVTQGSLAEFAADGHGSVMTLWQRCLRGGDGPCRYAWKLFPSNAAPLVGKGPGGYPDLYAGNGSFVLRGFNKHSHGIVVDASGQIQHLRRAQARPVREGDVLAVSGEGILAVDPSTARAWPLRLPQGIKLAEAAVSSDGVVWGFEVGSGTDGVSLWRGRNGHWERHPITTDPSQGSMPGILALAGSRVVALASFDGATVLPVGVLTISDDGGHTWTDLGRADVPFEFVSSIAATSGGTLYLSAEPAKGRGPTLLYRSTDDSWTHFTRVPGAHPLQLQPDGDRVLAQIDDYKHPGLVSYDDHGRRHDLPPLR